jgi:hypothetical protein
MRVTSLDAERRARGLAAAPPVAEVAERIGVRLTELLGTTGS